MSVKIPQDWDFRGWATKYNVPVSDGTVINHSAFAAQDGVQVPLVWNHQRSSAENVLGHAILKSEADGMYAYGYLNHSDNADVAREFLANNDIDSMSISANRLKRNGRMIDHGEIFELSLVLKGANPGAKIEEVAVHGDGEIEANIFQDLGIISAADEIRHDGEGGGESGEGAESGDSAEGAEAEVKDAPEEEGEDDGEMDAVIESLSEEQAEFMVAILDGEETVDEAEVEAFVNDLTEEQANLFLALLDAQDEEGDEKENEDDDMKRNAFDAGTAEHSAVSARELRDNANAVLQAAIEEGSTLQHAMELINEDILEHADEPAAVTGGTQVQMPALTPVSFPHGMYQMENLFPEFKNLNTTPEMIRDFDANADAIINGVSKLPFSRVRTRSIDITGDQARAQGFVKGDQKDLENWFKNNSRTTEPTTVYSRWELDRDDIIDITDFDIVAYIAGGMKIRFNEELARAVIQGDGRPALIDGKRNKYKINEDNIRPILTEDDFFVMKKTLKDFSQDSIDQLIIAKAKLRGSGQYSLIINPNDLAIWKLSKDAMGGYVYGGNVPSVEGLKAVLGVSSIIETSLIPEGKLIIGNLSDYAFGSTKGGEVTTFNDFDMDFNTYKTLIETRLSGSVTKFHAMLAVTVTDHNTIPSRTGAMRVINVSEVPSSGTTAPASSATPAK